MTLTAAGPDFYDAAAAAYRRADRTSRYRTLYREAARRVPEGAAVVDLGCGPGHFASVLDHGGAYLGLDFAPGMIREARRRAPTLAFEVADLRDTVIPAADVYVALEVLEHLDDDLGLLARLRPGATLVASVPSFDSAAHVRWFPGRADALRRYGDRVTIDELVFLPLPSGAFFHLFAGSIR